MYGFRSTADDFYYHTQYLWVYNKKYIESDHPRYIKGLSQGLSHRIASQTGQLWNLWESSLVQVLFFLLSWRLSFMFCYLRHMWSIFASPRISDPLFTLYYRSLPPNTLIYLLNIHVQIIRQCIVASTNILVTNLQQLITTMISHAAHLGEKNCLVSFNASKIHL